MGPNHRHISGLSFELGEYNFYLIGRDGKLLFHELLGNNEKSRQLDLAILEDRRVRLNDFSLEFEDKPKGGDSLKW